MFFRRSPAWEEVTFWALDLETSGLAPTADHVLSVGMVPVRRGVIVLGDAYQAMVRPPTGVSIPVATMRAHQIVPSELEAAPRLESVLPEVILRVSDGALLVHHAPLDLGFLKAGCRRAGVAWPRVAVVGYSGTAVETGPEAAVPASFALSATRS